MATVVRERGVRFELLRMRPHDHMGWVFAGASEFAALAAPYLTEGAALGERLMYVAEDPDPQDLPQLAGVVDPRSLRIATVADVYGSRGIVDPPRQLATFLREVADAKAAGYSGLRVVADNTSLVTDDERMKAWIQWEIIADHAAAEHPFTALCAFSKDKVGAGTLSQIATLHPLSSASGPVPQFRLFSDGEAVHIEGRVDSYAVTRLWLALETLPVRVDVVVDLATARLMGPGVLTGLTQLCDCGINVRIRGERAALDELLESVPEYPDRLVLEETAIRPRARSSSAS
ncbi:MAG TPA: MEDS domain-containing protein [Streptosporangiaceae bacterium]|nr:MEDS domain-containing protein [Streptosporangiaceae bacterium]